MNKYYDMFINDKIDDNLLNVNPNGLSYEDRFWHFACLALLYKNKKNDYMEKKCLSAACDLNYYYNAFIFFDAYEVLPKEFQKDLKKFEHQMNNEKLDQLINEVNKTTKKFDFKGFLLYMLTTLLIIPLMILLILVFKLDKTLSVIIAVLFLFLSQQFFSPFNRQRRELKTKKKEQELSKKESSFFNYTNHLNYVFNDPRYLEMIRAKDEEKVKEIAQLIKENKPIPEKKKKK